MAGMPESVNLQIEQLLNDYTSSAQQENVPCSETGKQV